MCTIVPTGVWIASAHASGILCVILINSTFIEPKVIVWPGLTSFSLVLLNKLCSSSLFDIKPAVNFVAYIGTFICFNKYGMPPIWSSCPCVITSPLILSLFFSKYVISGITKSTPSMSSSGKPSPQSTIIISSSYSITVMFFPISNNPPSGIIFKFDFLNIPFSSLLFGFVFLLVFVCFVISSILFFLSSYFFFDLLVCS